MHRQLKAERNFSSYPWVEVLVSSETGAGEDITDPTPAVNTNPAHSATDTLVFFIRSTPPRKRTAAPLRRTTSLPNLPRRCTLLARNVGVMTGPYPSQLRESSLPCVGSRLRLHCPLNSIGSTCIMDGIDLRPAGPMRTFRLAVRSAVWLGSSGMSVVQRAPESHQVWKGST